MHFTQQERNVLVFLALIVLCGSTLDLLFKKFPELRDIVNLVEDDSYYYKVDVNSATREELVRVPYIGEYTAANIIRYREEKGAYTSLDEIKSVKGIKEKNFRIFSKYLKL